MRRSEPLSLLCASFWLRVHCVRQLMKHKITVLRDRNTQPKDFRSLLHEITLFLGFEATRGLHLAEHEVSTPYGQYHGAKLSDKVAIIPILRAGLGMSDSMLELLPNAAVHHIGALPSQNQTQTQKTLRFQRQCD